LVWKSRKGNFKKILINGLILQRCSFCVSLTIKDMKPNL
jgi:hypothetical protein